MDPASATIDAGTRHAIECLIHRHAWLIDHGQAERVADLFAEDARLFGVGPDKAGRSAIAGWAGQRAAMTERRSRHVQTNIVLEPISDDVVRGTVMLTLYRHDGGGGGSPTPLLVGEYEDVYRRGQDDAWRFAERRLTILFGNA